MALVLFAFFGVNANAQSVGYIEEKQNTPELKPGQHMVSSGTGFFITNRGHIVTNAHVVKGCQEVRIKGAVRAAKAKVISLDTENDLALLDADMVPPRTATISMSTNRMETGDQVLVIGYPLQSGITGQYKVAVASVTDSRGPMNEDKWLQFSDSAQHGNSGGPLLDSSGNVIGVVVGKARMVKYAENGGQEETLSKSDIAISVEVLRNFLDSNRVYYRKSFSGQYLMPSRVESQAQEFIVNIQCDAV